MNGITDLLSSNSSASVVVNFNVTNGTVAVKRARAGTGALIGTFDIYLGENVVKGNKNNASFTNFYKNKTDDPKSFYL